MVTYNPKPDKIMKLTEAQTAAQKEIIALSKQSVQATALRLDLTKQEDSCKKEINRLMSEHGFTEVDGTVTMAGCKVSITVEKKETSTSSLDLDKLTAMLTPEQFKQCASVTQKAASEVLPQGLIDKCLIAGLPRISYAVKASKGFPVPEVKLFK